MSIELTRRDFIKYASATVSVAAMGTVTATAIWRTGAGAATGPALPPRLVFDTEGYLVDPAFEWNQLLPTFREFFERHQGFEGDELMENLKDESWCATYAPDVWERMCDEDPMSEDEIEAWLDSRTEPEDLNPWTLMEYTDHGAAIRLHEHLGWDAARELGMRVDECPFPSSSFVGIKFDGNLDELNGELARRGIKVVVEDELGDEDE